MSGRARGRRDEGPRVSAGPSDEGPGVSAGPSTPFHGNAKAQELMGAINELEDMYVDQTW